MKKLSLSLLLGCSLLLSACGDSTPPAEQKTVSPSKAEKTKPKKAVSDSKPRKAMILAPKGTKPDQAKPTSTKVFFAEEFKGEDSVEVNTFDCHQKIFTIIQLNNYEIGVHKIEVKWTDPYGKMREHTNTSLYTSYEKEFSWSSIKLRAGTGANLIAWANPAAGMEGFLGRWTVKVIIDQKTVAEETVDVTC